MAEETPPFANQPPSSGAPRQGAVASAVAGVSAVKQLLTGVRAVESVVKNITSLSEKFARNMAAGGGGAARVTPTGGVGSSGTSSMPSSLGTSPTFKPAAVNSAAGRLTARVEAEHAATKPLPTAGSAPTMPGTTGPLPTAGGGNEGGGGQRFLRRSGGGDGGKSFVGEKFEAAEPFFLPTAIARMAGTVERFAGTAYEDNILANRFAVGTRTQDIEGYQDEMYRRMAGASRGGAYSGADRQQGFSILERNFSESAVFAGGRRGMTGQAVGLSQSIAGLGYGGAAQEQAKLNRPQIVNMARAYGVQVRDSNGAVNYERVANDLLNRIFGAEARKELTPDAIALSFQPGNAAYYNLSQMGFDEESIDIVRRIAMGRARAGWGSRADLSDTDAGRKWRERAGLSNNVTKNQLNRAGEQQRLKAEGTAGAVEGIDATNRLMGELGGVAAATAEALDPLVSVIAALGAAAGTLPGSPNGDMSGTGSAALHAGTSVASLGAQFAMVRYLRGGAAAAGGAGAAAGAGGLLARGGGALLRGGIRGGVAGLPAWGAGEAADWGMRKAGVNNRWAQAGGGAAAGALAGAGVGAIFGGIGAVPGALIGGAVGGLAGLFAAGGVVPGDHNNDTVTIKATPGEVVVPRHTVSKHGGAGELMRKLGFSGAGRDDDSHYAKGGEVFGGVKPHVAEIGQKVQSMFGVKTIHGVGTRGNKSDHPVGLALDFMAEGKKGDQIASWLLANKEAAALKYLIWKQRINHGDGWKKMADRGGRTANHFDHVHASFTSKAGSGSGVTSGAPVAAGASGYTGDFFTGSIGGGLVSIMRNFGAGEKSAVTTDAKSGAGNEQPSNAPADAKGAVALGQSKAAARGWKGKEWDALYQLWKKESSWNYRAANPTSSARGIPQAMMSAHFGKGWKTDPEAAKYLNDPSVQIDWGLNYIKGRYGTPTKAWDFHRKHNYYSQGSWETKDEVARLHQGEMVIPAKVADGVRTALRENAAGMRSTGGNRTVNIYLTIAKASEGEARRLATSVKNILEEEDSMNKVAMS